MGFGSKVAVTLFAGVVTSALIYGGLLVWAYSCYEPDLSFFGRFAEAIATFAPEDLPESARPFPAGSNPEEDLATDSR